MKKIYMLLSIVGVVLLLTGCSYDRFKDRVVNYLTEDGYTCTDENRDFMNGSVRELDNVSVCTKEDGDTYKEVVTRYSDDFYIIYTVKIGEVFFKIDERTIYYGEDIAFYKGDTSYGPAYKYVKGSIDSNANKSYEYGAEVIDECSEEKIQDNEVKINKCNEVRSYLDIVNASVKDLRNIYNANDIPIRIEKER